MKRYTVFALLLASATLFSCTKELIMDQEKEKLDGRIEGTTQIDVTYEVDGTLTKSIINDNRAQEVKVLVNVNDSNLVWNLESNREWCKVVGEKHKGPGYATLSIDANESFDSRSQATLTFVAGAYRGFKITVDQEGSVFLLGQPFILASKTSSEHTVNVTIPKTDGASPEWTVTSDAWITATKGQKVREDDESVTVQLIISCAENAAPSRYGKVTLSKTGSLGRGEICVSQFGTEYNYDAAGNIWFEKDQTAKIEFLAPAKTISSVNCPEYASYSVEDVDEETVRVTITAGENFSDCSEVRTTESSLVLSNASATILDVPAFTQDYVPAHGLVTAQGLLKFAQVVNQGGDTGDWEKDGVVVMVGDIDMTGVTTWPGIGTSAHPFKGEFNGGGHTIDNLKKTSHGLFGHCVEATIEKVKMGTGCSIYNDLGYDVTGGLGGIVTNASSTVVRSCTFLGQIEFCGECEDEGTAFVGGIVGSADASSSLEADKFDGKLIVSSPSSGAVVKAGGIAGANFGNTVSCEFSGSMELATSEPELYAGGILAHLGSGAKASSNSFLGKIVVSNSSSRACVGGLYGALEGSFSFDFATDKSIMMGNIALNKLGGSTSSVLMCGNMIGRLEEGTQISLKGYESLGNIVVDHAVAQSASCVGIGGFIGGCDPNADSEGALVRLESLTNRGSISIKVISSSSPVTSVQLECTGGLIGYLKSDAEITGCTNEGSLGEADSKASTGKSNGKVYAIGGLVALAEMGNVTISKCANKANIISDQYNNNVYSGTSGSRYSCNVQGGIIGAFSYSPTHRSYTLNVTDCTVEGYIQGYRGITAGVVGYAENATISKCKVRAVMSGSSMTGVTAMGNNSSYKAGVAGVLYKSSIIDCEAKSDIYCTTAGSEEATPSGILSIDSGDCTISGCSYFGNMTIGTVGDVKSFGGIVTIGSSGLKVSDCKYGGVINGMKINENNVEANAVGTKNGTVSGITYWDGN